MKADTIQRNIQRSDSFQERSMGLAVGSEAFVFNVLRKDLYSDPIGSLIREYTVNAQDEHRKHGKSGVPILIKVPNQFEPELHIRDFAGGLTEEQVFEFFGNYGASDKRDSNLAVGFFGLGCKSAFAYTDSYIVKSFKDGKVFTFNIYIDETEIGRVAKIADENTSEPNGVLVIVPVQTQHISEFQKKVISTVSHFKTKPIIEGLSYVPTFEKKKAVIKGDDWEFFGSGTATVIMGEIAYDIDDSEMGYDIAEWELSLLQSDLQLTAEIGEIQVTASREALQMSPKTIASIRKRLIDVKVAMLDQTKKAFANAKSLFEAKSLYGSVITNGSGYGHIIRESGDKIVWKGIELKDSYFSFAETSPHRVSVYTKKWNGKIQHRTEHRIYCSTGETIYFDDTNKVKANYSRRAVTLLANANRGDKVTILHSDDVKDLEKIIGMPVSELESYNAVVPTMPVSRSGYGKGVDLSKRVKHTAKMFQLNIDKVKEFYKGTASNVWDIKDVEVKGGVYIPIDRFHPTLPKIDSLKVLGETLEKLEKLSIKTKVPIYGIKGNESVNGLIRFDKWIEQKLNASDKLKRDLSLHLSVQTQKLLDVSYIKSKDLADGLAKEYVEAYADARKASSKPTIRPTISMFNLANIEVKADQNVLDLSKQFDERYPIVSLVGSHSRGDKKVLDYIAERDS